VEALKGSRPGDGPPVLVQGCVAALSRKRVDDDAGDTARYALRDVVSGVTADSDGSCFKLSVVANEQLSPVRNYAFGGRRWVLNNGHVHEYRYRSRHARSSALDQSNVSCENGIAAT
jgi:hypothetical protein